MNLQEKPLQAIYFRDWQNAHIPEILEEVYLKKIYHPFLAGKKDLTIVDVGSNIGLTTYYFKDYAKRIIGLEPSQVHRETCARMLKENKITNVEILPYGLSNKKEKKKFYLNENNTAFSFTSFKPNTPFEEVDVITLDDLFSITKIDKIDILKMDSEGEEAKIFTSDAFKNNMDKIPVILGEFHEWTGVSQQQFMNMFRDYGYEFKWNHNTRAATFSAVKI